MRDSSYAVLLNRTIAPGDGMCGSGGRDYYFRVGQSAISIIDDSLAAADVTNVRSVLDYACGYGRVLRWIVARFPNAHILASDVDERALSAVSSIFSVRTRVADKDCSESFGEKFDLIWSGSLFTHLPEVATRRVLGHLMRQLSPNGILVFTTHGPYVERRIASGEKLYRLNGKEAKRLGLDFSRTGYGFGAYPRHSDYGISVITPEKMLDLIGHVKGELVLYRARGWARHQDVYAARLAKH